MGWYVNDLTAATGTPSANVSRPAGYAFEAQGTQHVIYPTDVYGDIYELWWDSNGWHYNDLTAATGAPRVGFDPTAYVFNADPNFPEGTQHVIYTGSDGHVHELWWNSNGWHHNDLTAATGSPWAFDLTAYAFEAQNTQHVVYLGNPDLRIHELWWDLNGWHHNDLTAATGAPLPQSVPTGYVFPAQNTQHVVYAGPDGHVHELWWNWSGWHHNDLTAATGAPSGASSPVGYVFQSQGTQHVVCWGPDYHIHELWWDGNGWHHNDLTAAANVPGEDTIGIGDTAGYRITNPLFGYAFEAQGTQHVVYTTARGHIRELWWDCDGWHCNDLVAAASAPLAVTDGEAAGVHNPTAFIFNADPNFPGGTQHVLYVPSGSEIGGRGGHLCELYWVADGLP